MKEVSRLNFTVGVDTIDQCMDLLQKKTKPYDLPRIDIVPYKQFSEGMLLRIKGDNVMLYCSKPSYIIYPSEAFYGRIVKENDKITIRGKMGFSPTTRTQNTIVAFGMLLLTRRVWFIAAFGIATMLLICGFSIRSKSNLNKREAIIDLLKSLEHIEC
ncbi:hypothetical protein SDC9_122633 [bioreactor metagenome]|uniref:Uncharacterized protein n=1 Tax=bioreactor metagenome TaxID=1076179 RepID=A0A645CF84_9ZZZZ